MSINVSEVIWTVICFFALLFVLKKFLFDPLIKFMDERDARIEAGLAEGRKAKQQEAENTAALQESWKQRSDEAKQILAEGSSAAEKERAKAVAEAQSAAAQSEKEARVQIEAEREAVLAEVTDKMPGLVDELAQQLLGDTAG